MARTKTPGLRQRGNSWEAWVWSPRDRKKIYRTFESHAAAKQWRTDASSAVSRGTLRAPVPITLRDAGDAWLEGAEAGLIRRTNGQPYKPSVIRSYRAALRLRLYEPLGDVRLSDIDRRDVQDLVDRMLADGRDPSTIRNALMPLRSIVRRAIDRNELVVSPLTNLRLPAVEGSRDRVATPSEVEALISAASEAHRAIWATACYAGLRRGELMALRWENVKDDRIEVVGSWDEQSGPVSAKSKAGRRSVPVPAILRGYLNRHKVLTGRREGLVFGVTAERPFTPSNVGRRAKLAWSKVKPKPLESIGLHECRHTYASMMIAAGVNAKALSTYMGHSSISITLDRYGKLFPGNEEEAAGLLEGYLTAQLSGAAAGAKALRAVQ